MKRFRRALVRCVARCSMPLILGASGCVPGAHDAGGSQRVPDDAFVNPPSSRPPAPVPAPLPPGTMPTVSAAVPPPALTGGTLLVLRDGNTAVAADPERDALFVADLVGEKLLATVPLEAGDQPGRLAEGAAGKVFVSLRRGGAVVAVNPIEGKVEKREPVCPAPRGITFDAAANLLYVACAGGELVSLNPETLAEVKRATLDRDLRDVVVSGDRLWVSRFRSAEVLALKAADFSVIERTRAPGSLAANRPLMERTMAPVPSGTRAAEPGVAWRMRGLPSGGAMMLHQESSNGELDTQGAGYSGGPCKGPMGAAVVEFNAGTTPRSTGQFMMTALPIDFDVSGDRKLFAMLTAGGPGPFGSSPITLSNFSAIYQQGGDCMRGTSPPDDPVIEYRPPIGEAISVAFDGRNRLVVQTREPARLEIVTHKGGTIRLSDQSRADTGHQLFHLTTGVGLACASCHPEGGDDGRVWRFTKIGTRRTQNLLGGIGMTAPFHWDGDMRDFGHLMTEVFTGRMHGPSIDSAQVSALANFIERLPALAPSPPVDKDAVARGQALFNDAKVACASCHKGTLLTDNSSRMVGTGGLLQVPSLRGIAARAPFMHDGCAKTLIDRFDAKCGGGDNHGVTSHLSREQLLDLVAYMESL